MRFFFFSVEITLERLNSVMYYLYTRCLWLWNICVLSETFRCIPAVHFTRYSDFTAATIVFSLYLLQHFIKKTLHWLTNHVAVATVGACVWRRNRRMAILFKKLACYNTPSFGNNLYWRRREIYKWLCAPMLRHLMFLSLSVKHYLVPGHSLRQVLRYGMICQ